MGAIRMIHSEWEGLPTSADSRTGSVARESVRVCECREDGL